MKTKFYNEMSSWKIGKRYNLNENYYELINTARFSLVFSLSDDITYNNTKHIKVKKLIKMWNESRKDLKPSKILVVTKKNVKQTNYR